MHLYTLPEARKATRAPLEPIYAVISNRVLYVGQTTQSIGKRLAQHCNARRPSELGAYIWYWQADTPDWFVLTMQVEEVVIDWTRIAWNFHRAPLDVKMELFFEARKDNPFNAFNRYQSKQTLHSSRAQSAVSPEMKHQFRLWDHTPPGGWEQTWIKRLDAKAPIDRAECYLIMLHQPPLNSTFNYAPKRKQRAK